MLEDDREELDTRVRSTVSKLQEASKVVDEYERCVRYSVKNL